MEGRTQHEAINQSVYAKAGEWRAGREMDKDMGEGFGQNMASFCSPNHIYLLSDAFFISSLCSLCWNLFIQWLFLLPNSSLITWLMESHDRAAPHANIIFNTTHLQLRELLHKSCMRCFFPPNCPSAELFSVTVCCFKLLPNYILEANLVLLLQ